MLSSARGPSLPLLDKTIGQVLEDAARHNPSGDALVSRHQAIRLSYRDLQSQVEQTARGLWGLRIRPGARVGMCAANRAEWIYPHFPPAPRGAVFVHLTPPHPSPEPL